MNQILKVGGLPVRARHTWIDSWSITEHMEDGRISFGASRVTSGPEVEIPQSRVRDVFLAIDSPEKAMECLRRFGPFYRQPHAEFRTPTEDAPAVKYDQIIAIRETLVRFIQTPSPECFDELDIRGILAMGPSPMFTLGMGHISLKDVKHPAPYLQQISRDVSSSVSSSIYIDKMAGLRGGVCERCPKVFLSRSDKPRRFCSETCGSASRQANRRLVMTKGTGGKND